MKSVRIRRLFIGYKRKRCFESGIVVASSKNGSSLCVIDVRRHDVVSLTIHPDSDPLYFRIGHDYSSTQTNPWKSSDSIEMLWNEITEIRPKIIHYTDTSDNPLFELIRSSSSPWWIKEMTQTLIQEWRSHNVDMMMRFAPNHFPKEHAEACSIRYPLAALKNIKRLLSPDQLTRCMVVSPLGAASYAFDELLRAPNGIFRHVIENYPEVLLELHAKILPEKILRACAYQRPDIAYELRDRMPPEIHAIFLSYSVQCIGDFLADETPLEDLQNETVESLAIYRDLWLATFGGDLVRLQTTLDIFLEFDLETDFSHTTNVGSINPFKDDYWIEDSPK